MGEGLRTNTSFAERRLTMPMKTAQNVPKGVVVDIAYAERRSIRLTLFDLAGEWLIDKFGALDIIEVPRDSHCYAADNLAAEHGWGPFLVDIAMEWVGKQSGWLYAHPLGVTTEAKFMWKVYFDPT